MSQRALLLSPAEIKMHQAFNLNSLGYHIFVFRSWSDIQRWIPSLTQREAKYHPDTVAALEDDQRIDILHSDFPDEVHLFWGGRDWSPILINMDNLLSVQEYRYSWGTQRATLYVVQLGTFTDAIPVGMLTKHDAKRCDQIKEVLAAAKTCGYHPLRAIPAVTSDVFLTFRQRHVNMRRFLERLDPIMECSGGCPVGEDFYKKYLHPMKSGCRIYFGQYELTIQIKSGTISDFTTLTKDGDAPIALSASLGLRQKRLGDLGEVLASMNGNFDFRGLAFDIPKYLEGVVDQINALIIE